MEDTSGFHKLMRTILKLSDVNLALRKRKQEVVRWDLFQRWPNLWLHCFPPVYHQKGRQDRLVLGNLFIIIYLLLQELCVSRPVIYKDFFSCLNHSVPSTPFLLFESATSLDSHVLVTFSFYFWNWNSLWVQRETRYFLKFRNSKPFSDHIVHYLLYTMPLQCAKYFSWDNLGLHLMPQFRKLKFLCWQVFWNSWKKLLLLLQLNI